MTVFLVIYQVLELNKMIKDAQRDLPLCKLAPGVDPAMRLPMSCQWLEPKSGIW